MHCSSYYFSGRTQIKVKHWFLMKLFRDVSQWLFLMMDDRNILVKITGKNLMHFGTWPYRGLTETVTFSGWTKHPREKCQKIDPHYFSILEGVYFLTFFSRMLRSARKRHRFRKSPIWPSSKMSCYQG